MASGKKNLRARWRAPVLPAVRGSGGCRRMSPCPETPGPFCGSGPAGRGVDQGVRFYRSRPVRRGNTIVAGAGPCADGAGDGHGCCALHPAARSPGWAAPPRILLLTTGRSDMRAGTGTCSGPGRGNCATPGFIRTDVGMPVADDRIDMCRTGPPCNATCEARPRNDTMDSPALPADRRPVPHRNIPYRNRSPAGNCGPAHCHRQVPVPGQFFPCFFPVFFPEFPEKSGRDWLAAYRPHSQPYCRFYPLRIWSGFMPCYQQVENRCFRQRRFIRADIPPDTPKVSVGVFHHPFRVFRLEGSLPALPGQTVDFAVLIAAFSISIGVLTTVRGGRGFMDHPEGAGAIDNRPLPRSGFSPARQSAAFSARGCSSAGYAPAGTGF